MANREHLEILGQGVEVWNQWREEQKRIQPFLDHGNFAKSFRTYPPDLSAANLTNVNLAKINLSDVNLIQANLSKSNLVEANLHGADLSNAVLKMTKLIKASLIEADCTEAIFIQADFSEAELIRANFSRANLDEAILNYAGLGKADLTGASLQMACLESAKLIRTQAVGADFKGALLTGACIEDWNINHETNFNGVDCKYIFRTLDRNTKKFSRRLPIDHKINFNDGDFELWIKVRADALETIDLTFTEGIEWQDFFNTLQKVRSQYSNTNIFLQGVEERGGKFVVRLRIESKETGKELERLSAEIETKTKAVYETTRKLDEACGEVKALERSLEMALRMLSSQGPKYDMRHAQFGSGFGETVQGDQIGRQQDSGSL